MLSSGGDDSGVDKGGNKRLEWKEVDRLSTNSSRARTRWWGDVPMRLRWRYQQRARNKLQGGASSLLSWVRRMSWPGGKRLLGQCFPKCSEDNIYLPVRVVEDRPGQLCRTVGANSRRVRRVA